MSAAAAHRRRHRALATVRGRIPLRTDQHQCLFGRPRRASRARCEACARLGRSHPRDRSGGDEQQRDAVDDAGQANRPFKYLKSEAARVLDMIKGSYLFDADAKRIIQIGESACVVSRRGAAWKAWSCRATPC